MRISCRVVALLASLQPAFATLTTDSEAGRQLLSQSRQLDENAYNFVGNYALKFQGCHHVQQWNDDVDEENDVRIMTKRLARFRLCPADSCDSDKSAGCSSKFGDYVVDLSTFVTYVFQGMEEQKEQLCGDVQEDCNQNCGENNYDCISACYDAYDLSYSWCNEDDGDNDNDFNIEEFSECAEIDMGRRRRLDQNNYQYAYYVGPYCADQGGDVRLGVFSDDTCTTFAEDGLSMYYSAKGYDLPYSEDSMISTRCLQCSQDQDGDGNAEPSETCTSVYQLSGKCETRMSIDYPNESSCGYIEGIKIVREDGVIRTSSIRKSKTAAVFIGLFMTTAVLLAGYVYYLRTKLTRAQINLSASQPLT